MILLFAEDSRHYPFVALHHPLGKEASDQLEHFALRDLLSHKVHQSLMSDRLEVAF